ncbi:MAG: S41 family peptidase [Bacteroidia bacterium]
MKSTIYLFLLSFLFLASCEQLFLKEESQNTPTAIFEDAWNFADQEYSFFAYKGVDWDEVKSRYQPLVNDNMSEEELFEVLADMLFELRDGHVNLRSDFDRSRNWTWYLNSPPNFSLPLLERSYFKSEQQFWGPFTVYDFEDVGYMRYSSFGDGISNGVLDDILTRFAERKGLIIDLRDNGGGSLGNAQTFVRRFAEQEQTIGRWRFKSGPGHEEFTDWEDVSVTPAKDGEDALRPHFYGPVMVLTNRLSYSATTFFTQYMRELPNVTILGDTTGGGGGAPSFTELANGWVLRVSATQLEALDGFNVEDGIPPDVQIDLDPVDEANGIDTILEEALRLIREM